MSNNKLLTDEQKELYRLLVKDYGAMVNQNNVKLSHRKYIN